ncbi:MAG: peptidyl-prolyl cis-trans isomerase, partial [Flavobacteriaceae bacterium]|nr:peptidyl-prolyl cis-trans isomerase [Flavobacteriaceae bacterium]
ATGMDALINFATTGDQQDRKKSFDAFFASKVLDHYKANLEKTNPEFAFSMQEYRDGLLLFNILEDTIWKRAQHDTLGLRKYFEKHRESYIWPRRADVILASCTRAEKAAAVKKMLEAGMDTEEIKKQVNEGATINVLFLTGIMEEGYNKLPEGFKFESTGVSDVIQMDKNEYVVVAVKKIIQPEPMKFQEARGKIMNDYQDYLEEQWIARLRQKYPVKVNQKVLKKIKKQQLDQGA